MSDVDMIFRLPASVYQQYDAHRGNGQSALLQANRKSCPNPGLTGRLKLLQRGVILLISGKASPKSFLGWYRHRTSQNHVNDCVQHDYRHGLGITVAV